MARLLSEYATSRDNNFNLIRFAAASLVLYTHSFALTTGSGDAEPLRGSIGMTWGSIAVDVFFITSGFLITNSYFSRNNLIAFVWARVLRIYPALIVAVLLCVFVIGLCFTSLTVQEYLLNRQTCLYLFRNSFLFLGVEFSLPGVFMDVPFEGSINGSLWTLPYEVRIYAFLTMVLGVIAYIGKHLKIVSFRNSLLLISGVSIILHLFNKFQPVLPEEALRLFSMFFMGSTYYAWRDKIRLSSKWYLFGFSLLLVSAINKDLFVIFYCLLLPYLIFHAAYVPSGLIRYFNKIGDYSYGLYIYAFPVQQSVAALIPDVSVTTMIPASFCVTLILAVLSWHLLEKRFLKMKGSYVLIEKFIQDRGLTRRFNRTN